MGKAHSAASDQRRLSGGSFYGSIQRKQERHDAIFTDLQHSSPRRLPAHSHELAFFALLLDGSYGETYAHRQMQFRPFTMMFRPAGIPHQDEIGPHGVKFFEIELRPAWQKQILDGSGTLDTPCDDLGDGRLLWLGLKLFRETRDSVPVHDLCVETLIAELVAAVARKPHDTIAQVPSWLARVREKLKAECCGPVTLNDLSAEAGVHPVHLSRVFRRCVGQGIGEYVHRLRVRAACESMLTPGISLAEIGLATGFADQSHFTRTFRKVTGMTPHAFRISCIPS